jgi:hypothetical protein
MNNREKAELVFEEELKEITEPNVKRFVLKCFEELTPDYFWDAPASSSGLHHPEISNGKHGLVRHVKLVCWWGKKLEEAMADQSVFLHSTYKSRDAIIAACLLHDLQKFGTVMKDGKPTLPNYASTHGALLALQMEDIYNNFKIESEDGSGPYHDNIDKWLKSVVSAVGLHMGRWSETRLTEHRYGPSLETRIVHLADYCASKKVDDKTRRLEEWEFPID